MNSGRRAGHSGRGSASLPLPDSTLKRRPATARPRAPQAGADATAGRTAEHGVQPAVQPSALEGYGRDEQDRRLPGPAVHTLPQFGRLGPRQRPVGGSIAVDVGRLPPRAHQATPRVLGRPTEDMSEFMRDDVPQEHARIGVRRVREPRDAVCEHGGQCPEALAGIDERVPQRVAGTLRGRPADAHDHIARRGRRAARLGLRGYRRIAVAPADLDRRRSQHGAGDEPARDPITRRHAVGVVGPHDQDARLLGCRAAGHRRRQNHHPHKTDPNKKPRHRGVPPCDQYRDGLHATQ